ncbi:MULTISPECIES: hypothetical protein [unclassified Methylobacterium]|uniref:hypothetical protein n=1 Tax=Methylobacterium sp. WL19 TaxID=2603896 RepID=UPI0009EB3113|nr:MULTISPECIES: hypothetical protein [unclassified Methylobacterium]TXN26751.1 hypothetical protein FV220_13990 [Methylobacterium sp. WL19]
MTVSFARWALLAVLLPLGTPALSAPRGTAQSASQEERFRSMCEPPLKLAAGACVRECPAGYRDSGLGYCSFQRMSD